jgi:hypothetical protein
MVSIKGDENDLVRTELTFVQGLDDNVKGT